MKDFDVLENELIDLLKGNENLLKMYKDRIIDAIFALRDDDCEKVMLRAYSFGLYMAQQTIADDRLV